VPSSTEVPTGYIEELLWYRQLAKDTPHTCHLCLAPDRTSQYPMPPPESPGVNAG
jgi:hypothetical protein